MLLVSFYLCHVSPVGRLTVPGIISSSSLFYNCFMSWIHFNPGWIITSTAKRSIPWHGWESQPSISPIPDVPGMGKMAELKRFLENNRKKKPRKKREFPLLFVLDEKNSLLFWEFCSALHTGQLCYVRSTNSSIGGYRYFHSRVKSEREK